MNGRISGSSSSARHRSLLAALSVVASVLAAGKVLVGQEQAPAASANRDVRANEMKHIAEALSVARGEGAGQRPVTLHAEPLLRWNDPTRNFSDASLWAAHAAATDAAPARSLCRPSA
jgi:hypothetical protein